MQEPYPHTMAEMLKRELNEQTRNCWSMVTLYMVLYCYPIVEYYNCQYVPNN